MGPTGAGDLRARVTFERRERLASGPTPFGPWQTLIQSRSAKLTPTRGGEQIIAGRLQGVAAFDLWVRWDSQTAAVTPEDRVVDARDASRVFAIRFAQDMDGRRRWILMQLELGAAE